MGVMRGLDGEQEFVTGLEKNDEGWSNGSYEVMKRGVEVDMIGEEKELTLWEKEEERAIERLIERCGKGKEVVRLDDEKEKRGERSLQEVGKMFGGAGVREVEQEVKRFRLVGEDVMSEEKDEVVVDSLEKWKLERVVKEKREKEERKKKEKEGMMARGKELGRSRENVKKLRRNFRDWKEEVEEVCYVLGESEERVRSFSLDMEIRRWGKELRELVSAVGLGGKERERSNRELVRSEVVVPVVVRRLEVLKEKVAVLDGRSYGEVLKGEGEGMVEEKLKVLAGRRKRKGR